MLASVKVSEDDRGILVNQVIPAIKREETIDVKLTAKKLTHMYRFSASGNSLTVQRLRAFASKVGTFGQSQEHLTCQAMLFEVFIAEGENALTAAEIVRFTQHDDSLLPQILNKVSAERAADILDAYIGDLDAQDEATKAQRVLLDLSPEHLDKATKYLEKLPNENAIKLLTACFNDRPEITLSVLLLLKTDKVTGLLQQDRTWFISFIERYLIELGTDEYDYIFSVEEMAERNEEFAIYDLDNTAEVGAKDIAEATKSVDLLTQLQRFTSLIILLTEQERQQLVGNLTSRADEYANAFKTLLVETPLSSLENSQDTLKTIASEFTQVATPAVVSERDSEAEVLVTESEPSFVTSEPNMAVSLPVIPELAVTNLKQNTTVEPVVSVKSEDASSDDSTQLAVTCDHVYVVTPSDHEIDNTFISSQTTSSVSLEEDKVVQEEAVTSTTDEDTKQGEAAHIQELIEQLHEEGRIEDKVYQLFLEPDSIIAKLLVQELPEWLLKVLINEDTEILAGVIDELILLDDEQANERIIQLWKGIHSSMRVSVTNCMEYSQRLLEIVNTHIGAEVQTSSPEISHSVASAVKLPSPKTNKDQNETNYSTLKRLKKTDTLKRQRKQEKRASLSGETLTVPMQEQTEMPRPRAVSEHDDSSDDEVEPRWSTVLASQAAPTEVEKSVALQLVSVRTSDVEDEQIPDSILSAFEAVMKSTNREKGEKLAADFLIEVARFYHSKQQSGLRLSQMQQNNLRVLYADVAALVSILRADEERVARRSQIDVAGVMGIKGGKASLGYLLLLLGNIRKSMCDEPWLASNMLGNSVNSMFKTALKNEPRICELLGIDPTDEITMSYHFLYKCMRIDRNEGVGKYQVDVDSNKQRKAEYEAKTKEGEYKKTDASIGTGFRSMNLTLMKADLERLQITLIELRQQLEQLHNELGSIDLEASITDAVDQSSIEHKILEKQQEVKQQQVQIREKEAEIHKLDKADVSVLGAGIRAKRIKSCNEEIDRLNGLINDLKAQRKAGIWLVDDFFMFKNQRQEQMLVQKITQKRADCIVQTKGVNNQSKYENPSKVASSYNSARERELIEQAEQEALRIARSRGGYRPKSTPEKLSLGKLAQISNEAKKESKKVLTGYYELLINLFGVEHACVQNSSELDDADRKTIIEGVLTYSALTIPMAQRQHLLTLARKHGLLAESCSQTEFKSQLSFVCQPYTKEFIEIVANEAPETFTHILATVDFDSLNAEQMHAMYCGCRQMMKGKQAQVLWQQGYFSNLSVPPAELLPDFSPELIKQAEKKIKSLIREFRESFTGTNAEMEYDGIEFEQGEAVKPFDFSDPKMQLLNVLCCCSNFAGATDRYRGEAILAMDLSDKEANAKTKEASQLKNRIVAVGQEVLRLSEPSYEGGRVYKRIYYTETSTRRNCIVSTDPLQPRYGWLLKERSAGTI
ncbi:MAG: hypothetical protein ACPGUD_01195 [Parashewanella sp.]